MAATNFKPRRYRIVEERGNFYGEYKGWFLWHRFEDADHGWRTYRSLEEARADIQRLEAEDQRRRLPKKIHDYPLPDAREFSDRPEGVE